MEKITSILSRKQSHFNYVSSSSLVSDALSKMSCQDIDYVVVINEDQQFAGIVTEHDIASKVIAVNRPMSKTKVSDIMNNRLPYASSYDTVEECMQLMQRHHTRYIPVFDDFNFVGVISSEDILSEAVYNRLEIFDAKMIY
ncbi:MAG: CBS domain-containing protein [Bacteroidetes bacterium]|nr:CBS domain-containing protein [Bacteroidota bacterium]MBS1607776.1 CBS domain-containing protein [Bacteroidota bacterium]